MSADGQYGKVLPVLDQNHAAALSESLHQFAQPLTVLQGVIELALTEPHEAEDYLRILSQAAAELGRLMDSYRQTCTLLRCAKATIARTSVVNAVELAPSPFDSTSSQGAFPQEVVADHRGSNGKSTRPPLQVLVSLPTVWLNPQVLGTEDTRVSHV